MSTAPRGLKSASYEATLTDLDMIIPQKDDVAGGQALLIIPVDSDNTDNYL